MVLTFLLPEFLAQVNTKRAMTKMRALHGNRKFTIFRFFFQAEQKGFYAYIFRAAEVIKARGIALEGFRASNLANDIFYFFFIFLFQFFGHDTLSFPQGYHSCSGV